MNYSCHTEGICSKCPEEKAKAQRDKGSSLKVQTLVGISSLPVRNRYVGQQLALSSWHTPLTPQCHLCFRRHLELQRQEIQAGG